MSFSPEILGLGTLRALLFWAMGAYMFVESVRNHYVRKRFRPLVAWGAVLFSGMALNETARAYARVRLMRTGEALSLDSVFWALVALYLTVGVVGFFVAFVSANKDAHV